MNNQRELFINEMKRMKEAIKKTNSEKLKTDYSKALKRKQKQLRQYDEYRKEAEVIEK